MQHAFWLWLNTAFYAAHVLEEYAYDWKTWATRSLGLAVDWTTFYIANAVVIILGICCAAVGWQLPAFSLSYPALMIINALVFHMLPTIAQRRFSPGLITAVVLFLPSASWTFYVAAQDGVLTVSNTLIAISAGALVMAYPIFLLKTKDKPWTR